MNQLSKDVLKDIIIRKHLKQYPLSVIRLSRCNKRLRLLLKDQIHEITSRLKPFSHNVNQGLKYSSEEGHKELVYLFINKGANNWNRALKSASRGGYRELVDFFINKGANNWNRALRGASRGGHQDLVDFFINKRADLNY